MKIKDILGLPEARLTDGDLGIESEVEGFNLPQQVTGFHATHDGSLRGEALEYVFKKPESIERADKLVKMLCLKLNTKNSQARITERCGIHVHVNVQNLDVKEMWNFVTLYYLYEEMLVHYCGKEREGSLFCLRAKDTDWIIDYLVQAATVNPRRMARLFNTDMLRYSALNFKALYQYGSLEFRSMRGSDDFDVIKPWYTILVQLRDHAKQYDSPLHVLETFNRYGDEQFTRLVFGDLFDTFTQGVDYLDMLRSSIENVEDIAYAIDWERYGQPSINPFNLNDNVPIAI